MSKKVVKQFEEQFGKEWRCQCKADFRPGNLEILSESVNSLLAHYRCPECGREQMLAAAISESDEPIEPITKQGTVINYQKLQFQPMIFWILSWQSVKLNSAQLGL